jgi:predicted nucleic acid-binding protein
MLGIDTNVVVRLVVADDAAQTDRARKLIELALSREEPVLGIAASAARVRMGAAQSLQVWSGSDSEHLSRAS